MSAMMHNMILCAGLMCWEELRLINMLWQIKSNSCERNRHPRISDMLLGPKDQTYNVVTTLIAAGVKI